MFARTGRSAISCQVKLIVRRGVLRTLPYGRVSSPILWRAFYLGDCCQRLLHPLVAVITKSDAFEHYLSVYADYPVARNAENAEAFRVRLAKDHGKGVLVFFHKRL